MKRLVFDIETGPLPAGELEKLEPTFSAPSNYKDPAKIAAHVAEQRREWVERAALSALTGQVLAIGIQRVFSDGVDPVAFIDGDEASMLHGFWELWWAPKMVCDWVGFNIAQFDLPFLVRRSWIRGVPVPVGLREQRWWSTRFVDLRDVWQLGDRQAEGSLDVLARAILGVGKVGSGADFSKLWETDRGAALEYLKHDVELTTFLADKLLG